MIRSFAAATLVLKGKSYSRSFKTIVDSVTRMIDTMHSNTSHYLGVGSTPQVVNDDGLSQYDPDYL